MKKNLLLFYLVVEKMKLINFTLILKYIHDYMIVQKIDKYDLFIPTLPHLKTKL